MIEKQLKRLGDRISRLRITRNLKQSELAYEAGISERTLQRMEAGEVVKTDGLLKVLAYLGRLEAMLEALDTPSLSPYELAKRAGTLSTAKGTGRRTAEVAEPAPRRVRVRTSSSGGKKKARAKNNAGKIAWPEDQA